MKIRKALRTEYPAVKAFYHSLIEQLADSEIDIGWKKDIYPTPDFLRDSISSEDLWIGIKQGKIIAAMVLNHQCNDGYKECTWTVNALDSEILVIHALGVHPQYAGNGYGKEMVKKAIEIAKQTHQKVIRLDVLEGNTPAKKLYTRLGFQYRHTLKMYYEDTGWTNYELYEFALEETL